MRQFLPLAIVAAVVFSASPATAGFIVNGGFEDPVVNDSKGYVLRTVADQGIPGWVIDGTGNGSGVDQIGTLWNGVSGNVGDQSVDIDFAYTLSQTFATIVGNEYRLEFFYSHNPGAGSSGSTGSASIFGDSELLSTVLLTHNIDNSNTNMNWLQFTSSFVADSEFATLTFAGDFDNGVAGWAVDSVSVTAVPEPTSLAIFGIGACVACIGGVRRRRGERQQEALV